MPFPSPGDVPDPGIEPAAPALAGGFFTTEHQGSSPGINTSQYFCVHQAQDGTTATTRQLLWGTIENTELVPFPTLPSDRG